MRDKIIVLKFGSSVLQTAADLPSAVHEIYRWIRQQHLVVAVVSAFQGETDRLLKSVSHYRDAQPESIARIVATGEEIATASLALELDRFGIPAQVLDASQIQIIARTCGNDTEPVSVDARKLKAILESGKVAVVPGFVARDSAGRVALFGRGGSDLSALFLAKALNSRCRLIKDVDGIFTADRVAYSSAQQFADITFSDAVLLGARIVQPKAVSFAERSHIAFEVAKLGSSAGTRVGNGPSRLASRKKETQPLKVGLLGLGTVGLGVFRELWKRPERFEVTGVAVRRPECHTEDAPRHLLTSDCWAVIKDADLVVEVIGGLDPARDLVHAALAANKHVVTANKLLVAENPSLSWHPNIRYSAAVGGAVPALEAVAALAAQTRIVALSGVLNGTCNYVLDRIAAGAEFADAIAEAQANGFAESDPQTDLSGSDSLCKLRLLARHAFPESDAVLAEAKGIEEIDVHWVRSSAHHGGRVRLVARAEVTGNAVHLVISPQQVDADHPFAQIRNEENALSVYTDSSDTPHVFTGRGAGRWPTTAAVMADLFDFHREYQSREFSPGSLAQVGGAA